MKFNEFKKQILEITQKEFVSRSLNPLECGIERAHFAEEKLRRLIALAQQTEFLTAKRKLGGWERQLARVADRRQRLERAKMGIYPGTQALRADIAQTALHISPKSEPRKSLRRISIPT